jgi:hypothetical protein
VATLNNLVSEVLEHQFSVSQYDPYVRGSTSTGREGILNQGLRYVAAQTDFRELFTAYDFSTSVGVATYALPADFARLYGLTTVDGNQDTIPLFQEVIMDFQTRPDASGQPSQYTVIGNNLHLWPTPDAAYSMKLRYYKLPALLTEPNDEPEIPSEYHHLLVSYALWHCYERENDYQSAQYHKARFDEDLMKARGEVQYDTDDYTQFKRVGDNRTDPLAPNVWTV